MRFLACALLFAAATPAAHAQVEDEQLWIKLSAETALSDGVDLELETNQRLGNADGGLYESQYVAKIGVDIGGGFKLTGGLNRVVAVEDGRVDNTEWRPRQELGFPDLTLGKGALSGRIRLEQRFRSDGDDVGHRVRPEISYTLPLSDTVDLELGHESYFNLNTTDFGQRAGHERMRNFVEIGFPLTGKVDAAVGYLNQYRFNRTAPDRMEHALTLGLAVKL
ncbi:MAG: DUF2490 domain-containing protein [Sphingomonas sp.]|uniref:DUF2490 domain-containing protein n=1 Tax=Sphingomonas sp. TaxID=28214 RepID=UPI00260F04E7|nr:DUF2490 domain-containing protein [Sphingomonas sp.]MDK2766321.1 DUF2490 domain-containing protein [Sphingomonas sp.]